MTLSERAAAVGLTERDVVGRGGLPWLTAEVLDGAGNRRLRDWAAAGFPSPDLLRLRFYGDEAIGDIVVRAIARVPDPIARHAIETAIFVGLGRLRVGMFCEIPPLPNGCSLIVADGRLSDEDLAATIAHEIAHAWRTPSPYQGRAIWPSYLRQRDVAATLDHIAMKWGKVDALLEPRRAEERAVAILARQWGFCGPAADPATCARAVGRLFEVSPVAGEEEEG